MSAATRSVRLERALLAAIHCHAVYGVPLLTRDILADAATRAKARAADDGPAPRDDDTGPGPGDVRSRGDMG